MAQLSGRSLTWYGQRLRADRLLVTGACVLGAALGLGLGLNEPAVFRSTAVVVATPQPPPGSGRDGLRRAPTVDSDAQLLTSDVVLTAAAERTAFPGGVAGLRDALDVTARSTSRVLRVRVTAADAGTAQAGAQAVAEEFLAVRTATDDVRFQRVREALSLQIASLGGQLASAAEQSLDPADDPEVEALRDELAALTGELTTTRASNNASGFVAEAAPLPETPARPHLLTTTASATLLGFTAGATTAVAREAGTRPGARR
ncbi:hypothetical protein [Aquipuribacter sp. SD81]|uniref:hypothetical protein n=1 Tax=Aquipuribacter sp. SD81 TaxID=3127703 RepID=UPI003018F06A